MQCWGRTTEIYNTAVACLLRTHKHRPTCRCDTAHAVPWVCWHQWFPTNEHINAISIWLVAFLVYNIHWIYIKNVQKVPWYLYVRQNYNQKIMNKLFIYMSFQQDIWKLRGMGIVFYCAELSYASPANFQQQIPPNPQHCDQKMPLEVPQILPRERDMVPI